MSRRWQPAAGFGDRMKTMVIVTLRKMIRRMHYPLEVTASTHCASVPQRCRNSGIDIPSWN